MIQIIDLAVFVPYRERDKSSREENPRRYLPHIRSAKGLSRSRPPLLAAAAFIARQERNQAAAIMAREAEVCSVPDQSMIEAIARLFLGGSASPFSTSVPF